LYESGDFYLKHLDQFKNNPSRKYSMISYLNSNWHESDGGELLIHQTNNNQKIAPTQGKTVFFKSDELVHEVLVTQKTRMSITGWLKSD
jgi:SM-20-related protein